jgi:Domain of unknown function (DUF4398)
MNALGRAACGVVALSLGGLSMGCATTRPPELVSAQAAYSRAAGGPAATLAPLDLQSARAALDRAESAYASHDIDATRDLSHVAQRKAELAEARADETKNVARDVATDAPKVVAKDVPKDLPKNVPSDIAGPITSAAPPTASATPTLP